MAGSNNLQIFRVSLPRSYRCFVMTFGIFIKMFIMTFGITIKMFFMTFGIFIKIIMTFGITITSQVGSRALVRINSAQPPDQEEFSCPTSPQSTSAPCELSGDGKDRI